MDKLDHRELTLIKRAAEDACHAMNRHYKPFIDAVAKPLMIIALVEMAQSEQAEPNVKQLKELLQKLIDDKYTTMRPSMAYEIQKALKGGDHG